ncbi:MAG: indole-3-glycerol phosphate synthase TrpC [Vicinamibacterales bacterium]
MTHDLLEAIVAGARRAAELRAGAAEAAPGGVTLTARHGEAFRASLRQPGIRIIAECKRRSPSRGVLRREYDPGAIAEGYAAHGAAAISVLTEPSFFDGALEHLHAVRARVPLPLLRKDFIVTEYQVFEAAAAGADAVLLIVAALDDGTLCRLMDLARTFGLAPLVEVHDTDELGRALRAGADIIGVNSRNLRTLQVHPSVLEELAPLIPADVVAVAESGLKTAADLIRLRQVGYSAFLIGERFMTEPDPGAALGRLRDDVERPWGA